MQPQTSQLYATLCMLGFLTFSLVIDVSNYFHKIVMILKTSWDIQNARVGYEWS